MSGLEVAGVSVLFGATTAVDTVSLTVPPGGVLAVLGPSGCGKSSLLRAIAGLEPVATGSITWDDADLARVPVHRRGFGLMFQDGQLFGHRDVAGNVEFGLRMAGVDRARRRERVAELLDLVGLAGRSSRGVSTLSGGEQQRVALARSLAPKPRLLLLDEPLSSLDRALRDRLTQDLRDILLRTGTTALYVTHDHDEAFTVAHRVAVMDSGRIVQTDRPETLWRNPVDESVARFLGYRWFVAGEVVRTALPDVATDARIGLRPESFVVDPMGGLAGTVLDHRFTRGGLSLQVEVPGIGRIEARASGFDVPGIGSRVSLRLEPAAVATVGVMPG